MPQRMEIGGRNACRVAVTRRMAQEGLAKPRQIFQIAQTLAQMLVAPERDARRQDGFGAPGPGDNDAVGSDDATVTEIVGLALNSRLVCIKQPDGILEGAGRDHTMSDIVPAFGQGG